MSKNTARVVTNSETLLTKTELDTWKKLFRQADVSLSAYIRDIAEDHDLDETTAKENKMLYGELIAGGAALDYPVETVRPIVSRILCELGLRQRAKRSTAGVSTFLPCEQAKAAFRKLIEETSEHVAETFWADMGKLCVRFGEGKITSKDLKPNRKAEPANVTAMPKPAKSIKGVAPLTEADKAKLVEQGAIVKAA